jgi:hypothetical protein
MFLIEIVVLIFLCRGIKRIVLPKGYDAARWQIYAVLAWIAGEMTGTFVSLVLLGKDIYIAAASGLLCAIAGYLLLRQRALNLPVKDHNSPS